MLTSNVSQLSSDCLHKHHTNYSFFIIMQRPLLNRFSINLKDGNEILIVDDNDLFGEQLCKEYNINYDDVLTINLLSVS